MWRQVHDKWTEDEYQEDKQAQTRGAGSRDPADAKSQDTKLHGSIEGCGGDERDQDHRIRMNGKLKPDGWSIWQATTSNVTEQAAQNPQRRAV